VRQAILSRSTPHRTHLRGAAAALSLTLAAAVVATSAPYASAEPSDGAAPAEVSGTSSDSAVVDPDVAPGEVESLNMEHLSNNPKNGSLQSTGSDIAFQGDWAFAGNYDGFTVYDLSDPAEPTQAVQVY